MKIVLLPGLDGTGVLFRPFVERLPADLTPIIASYPPDQQLGYSDLLPIVMEKLPREEPFVLLGESFSGPLALMAAATVPGGLNAVVLCATFVQNPTLLRFAWLAPIVRPFAFRHYSQFTAVKALLGQYSTPELRSLTKAAIGAVQPEVIAHRVRSVVKVNVEKELVECPVPVLYLRGARDLVVPKRNLREIQKSLPSIRVAVMDSPHMVLQTQPAACAQAISEFLSTLHPRDRRPPLPHLPASRDPR